MSIVINENKKKALASLIRDQHVEHLSRFPFAKYPVEPLNDWRERFSDPKTIGPDMLRSVLSWQCGCWQQRDKPLVYKKMEIIIIKHWTAFIETSSFDPENVLSFWQTKLGRDPKAFDVIALLVHLIHPNIIELADTHRYNAMRELLHQIEHEDANRENEQNLNDLERYTVFFRALLPKLQPQFGDRVQTQLDRFLAAYGNREVLAKVAVRTGATIEPIITSLKWETAECKRYNLLPIIHRSNADILFASLLLALDQRTETVQKILIGEVIQTIPLGSGGISNPGSFHYALIAMFGEQKGRDYFLFDDESLRSSFTEQANRSTRDMRFYRKYAECTVSINPKYIQA